MEPWPSGAHLVCGAPLSGRGDGVGRTGNQIAGQGMRRPAKLALVSFLALLAAETPVHAVELSTDPAPLVAGLLPSVVNISVIAGTRATTASGGAAERPERLQGSGFIVGQDGTIVTNKHVVAGARRIIVTLHDGTALRARVVGLAGAVDVAVLKVDAREPLPVATFADSSAVAIGQPVLAIGNPLGLGESVTAGIVSALNRDIQSPQFDDFIQTDAAINHGNSGGPLFNMQGQVIGMNTALYATADTAGSIGIGFSMPSNDVRFVVDSIERYGRVRAGWIGVSLQRMTPRLAEGWGIPDRDGAVVVGLAAGGPAARSGLRRGDVILALDGTAVPDQRALFRLIARKDPGNTAVLDLWRDGGFQAASVPVGERPEPVFQPNTVANREPTTPNFGLTLAKPTDALRSRYHIAQDATGAVVTGIGENSMSADTPIVVGDVIEKVQADDVSDPAQVIQQLGRLRAAGKKVAVLLIRSPSGFRWIGMRLD